MIKRVFLFGLIALVVIACVVIIWPERKADNEFGVVLPNVTAIAGSRTGTSTTPVYYGTTHGTTSKAIFIGSEVDTVVFKIYPYLASTTAKFAWNVLQSDDPDCATTATVSTGATKILAREINWYDAFPKTTTSGAGVSYAVGTTTFTYVPGKAGTTVGDSITGITQTITGLDTDCLRFDIGVASSSLYAEIRTK